MRKSTLISLLMALLLLGCMAIWRYMPRALSYDECSSVYRHFADMQLEGVRVTYIKDKLVGDSVRVPVTLLEAETDRGWELLDSLFGYSKHINSILNNPNLPDDVKALFLDDYHVGTFMAHRETPEKRIASVLDSRPNDVTVYWHPHYRCFCIFEPADEESLDAAFEQMYDDMEELDSIRSTPNNVNVCFSL